MTARSKVSAADYPYVASIVVPSRGGARRLPLLLGALTRQNRKDFEVIIVLDGDIDRSRKVVDGFSRWYGDRLRLVEFESNQGRVAALNAGFAASNGYVLIRCDDDLEPDTTYVSSHVEPHLLEENVGVVGLYRNHLADTRFARVYGRPRDAMFRDEAYSRAPEEWWHYWAGNSSVTRTTYDMVGEYDPDYRAYGWEDIDYGYRLHVAGVRVILSREAETTHHMAAVSTRIRMKRAYFSGAARKLFEAKHPHAFGSDDRTDSPHLWDRLVKAESALITTENLDRIGQCVDAAIHALPRPVAEKLVASMVEAASLAGRRVDKRLDRTF